MPHEPRHHGIYGPPADELDPGRILTLDDDFKLYRWRRRRPFDLLLAPH